MLDTIPKYRLKENEEASSSDPTLLEKLKGGAESHIEICTVDCSTYLLYPNTLVIETFFHELEAACHRVETIEKRNSGAVEIAVERRLALLPKEHFVKIVLKQVLLAPNLDEQGDPDLYEVLERREKEGMAREAEKDESIDYLPLASDEGSDSRKTTPTGSSSNLESLAGKVTEKIKNFSNSMFKGCEIQLLPFTKYGVAIISEKHHSSPAAFEASEEEDNHYNANFFDEHFLLGKNACLSPAEVRSVQLSLTCETTVKTKIKVASAKILIEKFIDNPAEDMWIDLRRKGKGKVEARLLLSIHHFSSAK